MEPRVVVSHPCFVRPTKDLAASRAHMLDAQQMAGTANQTLQSEVDLLRTERQEFHSQIRSLQDEKRLLSAEQEAQRHSEVTNARLF